MKEIIKKGAALFGRTIIINILCFFVVMSVITLGVGFLAESQGYVAYGVKENSSENTELYSHYFADGEDTKLEEYESQGYTVKKQDIKVMSDGDNLVCMLLAQFFALGILITFVYPKIWETGNKDFNLVKIGKKQEDKFKGLKIGFIGAAPYIVLFLVMLIGSGTFWKNASLLLFKFANASFYPLMELMAKGNAAFLELKAWQIIVIALMMLVIPAVAHGAYYLGYKDISLGEKFTYKKADKRR